MTWNKHVGIIFIVFWYIFLKNEYVCVCVGVCIWSFIYNLIFRLFAETILS